ncbi:MAG: SUMF1/EgtB/PvdO family nonheme iron enzyme [Balneola sp.]
MSDKTIKNIPPENNSLSEISDNDEKINCSLINIEKFPIYREKLEGYLQEIPLNCFPEEGVIFLDECFVSTPCDVYVHSYSVVNKEIKDIEFSENFLKAKKEGKKKIKDKIQKKIQKEIDFKYPILKKRPLVLSLPSSNGIKGLWQIDTIDIIKSLNKFILVGKAGSGKTIIARRFALELLSEAKYFPVYIELKDYFISNSTITLSDISAYISNKYGLAKNLLDQLFICNKNKIYYILDGIDEIYNPKTSNKVICQRLNRFVHNQENILLTSRANYSGLDELTSFPVITTKPLLDTHIHNLFVKYFRGNNAENNFTMFKNQISELPLELKERPLFIVLLTNIFNSGEEIPNNKITIFERFISLLLFQWKSDLTDLVPNKMSYEDFKIKLLTSLEKIAYSVIINGGISNELFCSYLNQEGLLEENCEELIAYLINKAGIIESQTVGYGFVHRSFAEYLAAKFIVKELEYSPNIYKEIEDNLDTFKEPILYVGDILRQYKKFPLLRDFVMNLVGIKSKPNWTLWLATKIFHQKDFDINPFFNDYLRFTIKKHIKNENVLPPIHQVEITNLLGKLGDDRRGVNCDKFGIPNIYWLKIKEGSFSSGLSKKNRQFLLEKGINNFNRDSKDEKILLKEFSISKYPITIAQFKVFLEDEYFNPIWWNYSDKSKDWFLQNGVTRNKRLQEKFLDKIENHPATNVTWFEAKAYCSWLSSALNLNVDLPTSLQWEKASKSIGNFLFTWGNKFSEKLCNTVESTINGTSPVGCFSETNNYPLDMIGNVWEWCLDTEGRKRIVKGGSFYNKSFSIVRSTFNGRDYPDLSTKRQGFRIVQNLTPAPFNTNQFELISDKITNPTIPNLSNEIELIDFKKNDGKMVEENCNLSLKYSVAYSKEDLKKEINLVQSFSNLEIKISKNTLNKFIYEVLSSMTATETIIFKVSAKKFTNNNDYNSLVDLNRDLFIECHINSIW